MTISLCITVFNEASTIETLLQSIVRQTKKPDEVIIVDGGSTDDTVSKSKKYESSIKNLQIIIEKGNRPYGRNISITHAKGDVIAITDAGCELDQHWIEEITKPFIDSKVRVVSGYYAGKPRNAFEAAMVPYVLVMPDKVDQASFLPSTRSMAMRKTVWQELGGFPLEYRWNEDYVFSKRIEKKHIPIVFAQKAIVYWTPRESIGKAWSMFYAFAKGDAQAGIWRRNVFLLFLRYGVGVFLVIVSSLLAVFSLLLYILWAISKNYRYVKRKKSAAFLPVIQFCADTAVLAGTVVGWLDRMRHRYFLL